MKPTEVAPRGALFLAASWPMPVTPAAIDTRASSKTIRPLWMSLLRRGRAARRRDRAELARRGRRSARRPRHRRRTERRPPRRPPRRSASGKRGHRRRRSGGGPGRAPSRARSGRCAAWVRRCAARPASQSSRSCPSLAHARSLAGDRSEVAKRGNGHAPGERARGRRTRWQERAGRQAPAMLRRMPR